MYFEEAVKRINSIDWENFGKNEQRDEEWLVNKYLNRLEELVWEYGKGAIPLHPAYCANVAQYLGDTEALELSDYCAPVVLEKTEKAGMVSSVIEWYLQLARYAEHNELARKYVDIFDPLIALLERGWKFYSGDGGINVPGTAYWPLHGWYNRALKSGFRLRVKDLQWINGEEDNPDDLCCHGQVTAVIGGHILERTANVSASALYFLKTLTEDYIINEDNQMIPCCGHFMIPNEDGRTVTICGCPQGIDWTVLHEGDNVKMILEDETEVIVSLEKYREQVYRFADEIEAFYNSCTPKKLPEDEWERNTYLLFWEEWHRRRGVTNA